MLGIIFFPGYEVRARPNMFSPANATCASNGGEVGVIAADSSWRLAGSFF